MKRKFELKAYPIIEDKVQEWIPFGINRYYKHREEERVADEDALAEYIVEAVMLGLSEIVDWE